MTTKLYWDDSHLVSFTARVTGTHLKDGRSGVLLDQSAFYPEGGGQPSDTGTIAGKRISSVEALADGTILHFLEDSGDRIEEGEVACEVDWHHRREMMQQHSGQHILSQAFFRLFGAETRGFRITDHVSEIDLAFDVHQDEIPAAIRQAEDMANAVIFDDREIRSYQLTTEEASRLPLRKESFVTDCVRVVEIDNFDLSPCGGTHARRTGEVGLIVVRGWVRAKRMVRVEFLCGGRALGDYREENRISAAIARRFTVARHEAEASLVRLMDDNKVLLKRVRELSEIAIESEAASLRSNAEFRDGVRTIIRVFDGRDYDEMKLLAHRLVTVDSTIAILATKSPEMVRLVIARSANLVVDANLMMKSACEILGGRGGGKPDFAQGGGPKVSELKRALERISLEKDSG